MARRPEVPLDLSSLEMPDHVAIIMDGNGRWARKRGLPRQAGHRAGAENLRRIIRACVEFNIKILTIYAFSTENWGRPKSEVQALMKIFARVLDQETDELNAQGVCVHHLGELAEVDPKLQEKVRRALELTRNNDRLILNIAFNYGGRLEIIEGIKKLFQESKNNPELVDNLTPQTFGNYLYTAGQPDPDLIIRTSGEYRLSNFLLWQSAYAEIYITETLWPDFDKVEFLKAIIDFQGRKRRFGGIESE